MLGLGEKDLAIKQLEEVIRIPSPALIWSIKVAPVLGSAARRSAF